MTKVARFLSAIWLASLCGGCAATSNAPGSTHYLYAWSGDDDQKNSDFLAVIDADPTSSTYGEVLSSAPTGVKATMAHHVEYETPPGRTLFANGWAAGHSFVFDISDALSPRVTADFRRAGDFIYPHSFVRLPNGHVLATFQSTGTEYVPPGALVELDDRGNLVRATSSATQDIPDEINWPYSLAVSAAADRVVTTSTDMGMGPEWKSPETRHVQVWRLSDLRLLSSVALPDSGVGKHHTYPAEPRILADGSVYVSTFSCGLYRIDNLSLPNPTAKFVHAFPSGPEPHDMCAVPLVYGKYWIQSVGAINGIVVLDASDPDRPVEVSRLLLGHGFHGPHWLAADRSNGRIAVTGMYDSWLAMLKFDATTGRISLDAQCGEDGGIQFDRAEWPHGSTGKAIVHGAVFSR